MIGIIAAMGLLSLYAGIMTVFAGWQAATQQFQSLWWLMVPLAVGFGIQVQLFTKLHKAHASLVAGGSSASVGMIACCAHHVTDALPFVGLSGASILLTRYQIPILLVSLGINGIGIMVMIRSLQKMTVPA